MINRLLMIVGVFVAIVVAIPAALPSKMHLSRSVEIQTSQAGVHAYLADLNQYSKWNPFSQNDPASIMEVTGTGVGSFLTWKGGKTGEGRMTITQIEAPQNIRIKLEFFTPMAGEAMVGWTTEAVDATKTRMTWSMDQELSYMKRYFGLMMGGVMGKTFERGLENLKKQLEKT